MAARRPIAAALAALALTGLFALRYGAVVRHAASDFVDFDALHDHALVFELADTRLNSWILAWVDHTLWRDPGQLYQGNIHHPARDVLTGSEHLLGVTAQLLPFEPFVDGAVARHQLALALAAALTMATSFVAVRWATGSGFAAVLAAAFALGMPWRTTEISHLQLVSAQWMPLVWAATVRGLLGDSRPRVLAVLGVAVALQLLTSFYLAYFLTLSSAVVVAAVALVRRPAVRDVARLAAAVAPGYALFVASALPYLARQASSGLAGGYAPALAVAPAEVLAVLAPRWPWSFTALNEPATYWTPWGVLALAVIGAAAGRGTRASTRERAFSAALLAVVGLALVMMLGGSLELGSLQLPTPARALSDVLPGFSLLRGPTRWGILVGTAAPLLAGLGAGLVERAVVRRLPAVGAHAARAALAAACAGTFAWFRVPTTPAWPVPAIVEARYAALRALPEAPLLELPWALGAGEIEQATRSVLASTLHWRPIVNGYTGHRPDEYRFVQHVTANLPAPRAIRQLRRLTGVRHVLLDLPHIEPPVRERWAQAARAGLVDEVHASLHTRIYALRTEPAGDLIGPLLDPLPRLKTFDGLPRDRLVLEPPAGRLVLDTAARHDRTRDAPAYLRVRNDGRRPWPGFDDDPEGLVQLRYSYFPLEGGVADERAGDETRLVPLHTDVPAGGRTHVTVHLRAPRRSGRYELCADLVQRIGDEIHRLPIESARRRVTVRGVDDETALSRTIDDFFRRETPPPPCGRGR